MRRRTWRRSEGERHNQVLDFVARLKTTIDALERGYERGRRKLRLSKTGKREGEGYGDRANRVKK
jgi:hypothetical protein